MPYLLSSKAAPVHNMLSEQTLGLVDYHVRHAPNTSIGFIDGKVKCTKQFKHYPGFWAKLVTFKTSIIFKKRARFTWQQRKANDQLRIKTKQCTDFKKNKVSKIT